MQPTPMHRALSRSPSLTHLRFSSSLALLLLCGVLVGCGADSVVPMGDAGQGPMPNADVYTVTPGEPLVVVAADGVLVNDTSSDPSGDGGMLSLEVGPRTTMQGVSVDLAADGSFTYATPTRMAGADSFTYVLVGADGVRLPATVTLQPRPGCADGFLQEGELCFPSDDLQLPGDAARLLVGELGGTDPDVVVVGQFFGGGVFMRRFESGGGVLSAGPVETLESLVGASAAELADLDGDGDTDLVVATSTHARVFFQDASGGLTPGPLGTWGPGYDDAISLATGHFDADTHRDIAIAREFDSEVHVLHGDGAGNFVLQGSALLVSSPEALQALDVGADGTVDLVINPRLASAGGLRVLRGDGLGGFVEETLVAGSVGPVVLEASFNADSHPDLLLPGTEVRVLPGDGAGGYGTPISITPPTALASVYSAALGDYNGDTRLDLAASTPGLRVAFGGSTAALTDGFSAPGFFPQVATLPGRAGADDLVVLDGSRVSRFTHEGANGMREIAPRLPGVAVGAQLTDVQLVDLNGDDRIDALLSDYSQNRVYILVGDGGGGFSEPLILIQEAGTVHSTGVGHLDGDPNGEGSLDVLVAETSLSQVGVWLADGAGGFTEGPSVPVGPGPARVVVADFNGDNRADFATANVGDAAGVSGPNQDTVSIRLGVGDGTFITPTVPEVLACGNPERLVVGHVNADEHLDLVVACLRTEEVAVLLGDGLGGFTHASASPLAPGPAREVAIANVGGSAALDLVITQETRGTLAVWLGAGDGSFAFASEAAVDDVTYSVTLADFNGDMRVDAAATTLHGAVLLLGNGDGSFRRPERWRLGAPGNEIASADLDGDGVPEIVLVGQGRATTLQSAF